jgi:hypothetical protein
MDSARELPPRPALRLIFEYDGDEVRLVSQHPVDVAVSGFDLARVPRPGHYVETRSEQNEPLSRVPVREAFSTSAEVFPERPGEPITRVDVPRPRGAFTVVVPAGETVKRVALIRVQPPPDEAPQRPGARATTPTPAEPEIVEMATFAVNVGRRRPKGPG